MNRIQNLKREMKLCFKLFLMVVCSVLIATAIMILLYAVPTGRTYSHAKASAKLYSTDMLDNWSGNAIHTHLSNSTDSLMIMHAIYHPYDSVVDNAMLNPRPNYNVSGPENLVRYLQGEEPLATREYARYWHGYLLYIIPGLQILTVGQMKTVMMYVQFFLTMILLYELGRRNPVYMLLYGIIALFINPVTTVLTFQDADIYCIMMIFMIVVLKCNDWLIRKNLYAFFFTLNGILVAFFDYLTYPLVAYGVPMITVLLLNDWKFKESVKNTVRYTVSWGWGYAGMWMGKWIMADILTGSNTISSALSTAVFRTSGDVVSYGFESNSYPYTLRTIFGKMMDNPMQMLMIATVLLLIACIYGKKLRFHTFREYFMSVAAIVLVGLTPFVWFFVVRNHTIIHPHLEYRQLAVSLWAVLVIVAKLFTDINSEKKSMV